MGPVPATGCTAKNHSAYAGIPVSGYGYKWECSNKASSYS
jgi:hypothetical protein